MARRIDALIPLSWDHHHGLNLARKISATLDGQERFGSPSYAEMRQMVLDLWEAELAGHFEDEEHLIGPRAHDQTFAQAVARMASDHMRIIRHVDRLRHGQPAELPAALRAFAETLTEHIRFEESELFPLLETRLDDAQARDFGQALLARRQTSGRSSEREARAVRGELLPEADAEEKAD